MEGLSIKEKGLVDMGSDEVMQGVAGYKEVTCNGKYNKPFKKRKKEPLWSF